MKQIPKTLLAGFLLFAFIGFADAAYLTAKHYLGEIPPCSIVTGCETVLTSAYATLPGNIPIALVGALYYLMLFIGGVIYLDTKNTFILKTTAYGTTVGFLTSVILINLQVFIIRAICLYCVVSAAASTILFIISLVILKRIKKENMVADTPPMPILMR